VDVLFYLLIVVVVVVLSFIMGFISTR